MAANQSGNSGYSAATEVTTSFTVAKLSQTISAFSSITSKTPGAAPFTITPPTASSGLTVAVTVKSGPATISGNTVTLTGAEGTVVLAANQSGNSDYAAATEVTTSFTVAKASQTISAFSSITSKTPGAAPFTITPPTASSGLTVAVTVKSGPATISGNTVTLTGVEGTVVLAANQSGNADYNAATEVTTSFTVAKISQTIASFAAITSKTPGAAPFTITPPTASSGLSVTLSVKSGPATISGNTVTLTGAEGTVVLAANQSGNADYAAATEVTTSFTVAKASQTISAFSPISSKTPGAAPFNITLPTASSGLPVTVTVKSGPATISGNTVTLTGAEGTVVLAANQSGNTDYNAATEVTTSFVVAKLQQAIERRILTNGGQITPAFFQISSKLPGAAPFTITPPTASSGLSVTLSVTSGPATISGNTVTLTGVEGTVVLAANQSGNSDYAAATEVTTSFTVAKLSQTISAFSSITSKTPGAAPFTITPPTASSGLTVAVTVKSGPATISGNTVTLTGDEGTVVLAANQSGNADYSAAPEVMTSFTVARIAVTISLSILYKTYNGSPHAVTATTKPSGFTPTITYNGSTTPPTSAGSYTVRAVVDTPDSSGLAPGVLFIAKAAASITLSGDRSITYDGNAHAMTAVTTPAGLATSITYNGAPDAPTNSGTYSVVATITDPNYTGRASAVLRIAGQPYYFNNAAGDGSFQTLGNWWLDSSHTTAAVSLPTFDDTVYIDAAFIPDSIVSWPQYAKWIFGKYSTNLVVRFKGENRIIGQDGEFWNGCSIAEAGASFANSTVVHYPCAAPLDGIFHGDGKVTYRDYPYIVQTAINQLPVQTLYIGGPAAHGDASWGARSFPPISDQSSASPGAVKEGDDFLFQVVFHGGNNFSSPKVTRLLCAFYSFTGEAVLSSTNFMPCVETGRGEAFFSYLFVIPVTSPLLSSLLGSYATTVARSVTLRGEISWNEVNETGVGPAILTQRSANFPLTVTRALTQGTDYIS